MKVYMYLVGTLWEHSQDENTLTNDVLAPWNQYGKGNIIIRMVIILVSMH